MYSGPTLPSSMCLQLTASTAIGAIGDNVTSVVVEGSKSAIGHVRNHSLAGSTAKDEAKRVKNATITRALVRLFLSYPVEILSPISMSVCHSFVSSVFW